MQMMYISSLLLENWQMNQPFQNMLYCFASVKMNVFVESGLLLETDSVCFVSFWIRSTMN